MDPDRLDVVPVASIVIPARNEETLIGTAIESVLANTRFPIEIVVIDDHSTDGTAERAGSYPGVRVVTNVGTGFTAALNSGLGVAVCDLIAYLDADDAYLPGGLELLIDTMLDDPELIFAAAEALVVDSAGRPLGTHHMVHTLDQLRVVSMAFNVVIQSATIARRRSVIELGGYRSEAGVDYANDFDLYSRLLATGRPCRGLTRPSSRRLIRTNSITNRSRGPQVNRAGDIRARNQARWHDLLAVSRLRVIGRECRKDGGNAFDVYALALVVLTADLARRARFADACRVAAALLLLGPVRAIVAGTRELWNTQRRRRARGWSRWSRRR